VSRKVITKKDALAVAYYLAADISKRRSLDGATATFFAKWDGKWKTTDYSISGRNFFIAAGRVKHSDGRIRDAHAEAEGLLNFAIYAVRNFPGSHSFIRQWAQNLRDQLLVAATLESRKARDFYLETPVRKRWSMKTLISDIQCAETLGVLAS
jgi:hypothetical protein